MVKEIYTAALGMLPQQTRLEAVTNNIANANSVGFRRSSVFERGLIEARNNMNHIKGDVENVDAPIGDYTDFASGTLQKTDNTLDIAIEHEGFFVVQNQKGEELLTRAGQFTLSEEGYIATQDGKKLLGEQGPIMIQPPQQGASGFNALPQVDLQSLNIRIAENGEVLVGNRSVGRIQITVVDNPQTLERVSGTDFRMTDTTKSRPSGEMETRLRQGYVETSNVDIIREMVDMIELQRAFEMGQKVITTNDHTIDRSIELSRYS